MEISDQELRRLVRDVDDQHRAGMETLDEELTQVHASRPAPGGGDGDGGGDADGASGTSRRGFLRRAAFGGLTFAIGTATVSVVDLLEATPAGAADEVPTDAQLVAFSESVELALV